MSSYSPHHNDGGTLHLPSPTHLHHDAITQIQLRRSLSRSPVKGPTFRLVAAKSTSPSPSSPLSPHSAASNLRSPPDLSSPTSPAKATISSGPLGVPIIPSARKARPARRSSPKRNAMRSLSTSRSSVRRILGDRMDHGNATPPSSAEASEGSDGPTSRETTPEDKKHAALVAVISGGTSESFLAPHHAFGRRERSMPLSNEMPPRSSPLKRHNGPMNLDHSSGDSPLAKRRSLHGGSFAVDFSIFDQAAAGGFRSVDSNKAPAEPSALLEHANTNAPMPQRTSSLRKTTLQQRQDKPSLFKARAGLDLALEVNAPGLLSAKARTRLSLDNALEPPARESPFSSRGALPSASLHKLLPQRKEMVAPAGLAPSQRHPLSRTITQSSSGSSLVEDSPTHVPIRKLEVRRPSVDFSKSLPLGGAHGLHSLTREPVAGTTSAESSFATPANYKLAKPLPAVFMSTGLISKRTKDLTTDEYHPNESVGHMPDTPCKKPVSMTAIPLVPTPDHAPTKTRPGHRSLHSFGTPSTPFNPHSTRPAPGALGRGVGIFGSSVGKGSLTRRASFLGPVGDEGSQPTSDQPDSQSSTDYDIPPTPTKSVLTSSLAQTSRHIGHRASSFVRENREATAARSARATSPQPFSAASPSYTRIEPRSPRSPRTPQDAMLPPDPSGLSISARGEAVSFYSSFGEGSTASIFPATPTASRDSFPKLSKGRSSIAPMNPAARLDVDPVLTARFTKVQLIGTGDFSQVFRVAGRGSAAQQSSFALPMDERSNSGSPDQVWAVKKTRQPYIGPRDRRRKLQEVEILKALGPSDHTIQHIDSWEEKDHLYIQLEFCEEGSLDLFLDTVGRKARLDDFRIWKILLELSQGVKHIHDSGFIHLDLKPANILITFEGVLKIGDFGMAAPWPAPPDIEGEGDREYIGPEILLGQYDKPADLFALGLIMLEIAGNVMLPDNGLSWQRLRNGDMTDVPSLTSNSDTTISRDSSGKPLSHAASFDEMYGSDEPDEATTAATAPGGSKDMRVELQRAGELVDPPSFMIDPQHEQALDKLVRWMIAPRPSDRPAIDHVLAADGVRWAETRRRAGATIYEGNWGPSDEILHNDAEMMDV